MKEIFAEALERAPGDRDAFMQSACGDDASLLAQVRELLSVHANAASMHLGDAPTLGTPLAIGERIGESIGLYKLLELIGEGGFGTVYAAEQDQPVRRRVALKVIKVGMDTRQVIARFEQERQALAVMDHPNIAKVFDAGATPTGRPYFVMELVEGAPITTFADEHNLTIHQRLTLMIQVCHAVHHAHQKGVIHRDLKPTNVLVSMQDGQPQAKVIDFGVAKATEARLTEKTLFTESNQLIGTPEYMSPEQAEATLDIDTRTDVYSLGALLYELLTGTTPFDGRELRSKAYAEIQRTIREVEPPAPSTRLSTISRAPRVDASGAATEPSKLAATVRGELDWIVMKCLEKDRERRYDSAAALADDVLHYIADEPVSAAAPSRRYRIRKFVRRNRTVVAFSTLALLLLIGGVVGTTIGFIREARQRVVAQREAVEAKRQWDNAGAVIKFQQKMLASADPNGDRGDKVTVLQALESAIADLDAGQMKDQPLVESNIRDVIGLTMMSLGHFDVAEANIRKGLEQRQATLPHEHAIITFSLQHLGDVLLERGQLPEAERVIREVVDRRSRETPRDPATVVQSYASLGAVLRNEGKLDEAEQAFRKALKVCREELPSNADAVVNSLSGLGTTLRRLDRYEEAEAALREAVALMEKSSVRNAMGEARIVGNLAGILARQDKNADAETMYRKVLAMQEASVPAGHPDLGITYYNLGTVLLAEAKVVDAEALFRRTLENWKKSLGPDHVQTGRAWRALGASLTTQKKFDEAEKALLESERVLRLAPTSRSAHETAVQSLVDLYTAWDADGATGAHADQLARWRNEQPRKPSTTGASTTRSRT